MLKILLFYITLLLSTLSVAEDKPAALVFYNDVHPVPSYIKKAVADQYDIHLFFYLIEPNGITNGIAREKNAVNLILDKTDTDFYLSYNNNVFIYANTCSCFKPFF
jgi:hypothetical protein